MLNKRIVTGICVTALAAGSFLQPLNVAAQDGGSEKEEVVYAILDEAGNVTGVYAVNSFSGGKIVDYGDYKNVKNLTTTDKISYENGKVTLQTDADKIYYQGDMETTDIPWKIKIQYELDGKECTAEELAGKTGALKIRIKITRNKECDASYWKGYALQASLTLDGNRCENIQADGATIANVGSDKQLSYIILPKKGADLTITADVKDFEMDEISVNATKLNLSVDVESDELEEKVEDVQEAVKELDDGAGELDSGAEELKSGAKDLYSGSKEINDGTKNLDDGVKELNKGIAQMKTALETLDSKSDSINSGSTQISEAIGKMQKSLDGAAVDAKQIEQLTKASSGIKSGIDSLAGGISSAGDKASAYKSSLPSESGYLAQHDSAILALEDAKNAEGATDEQKSACNEAIELLKNDKSYISKSYNYADSMVSALGSQGELASAGAQLKKQYGQFDDTIQSMAGTLSSLAKNMEQLKSGVDTLNNSYSALDSGIKGYTKAVSQITESYEAIYNGSLNVAEGTGALYSGTTSMTEGALKLYNGSADLKDGTQEMADGTGEFRSETENMDSEITGGIDDAVDEMTGKEVKVKSFTSKKNKNVDSVLFVMKTPAIEIPEQEEEETTEKKESVMDKIKGLFQ